MFYSFDLDLDLMTLVLKLDLDMVKMYLHTKNKVPSYSGSKVIAWTDTQTHKQNFRRPSAYADVITIRYLIINAITISMVMWIDSVCIVTEQKKTIPTSINFTILGTCYSINLNESGRFNRGIYHGFLLAILLTGHHLP